MARAENQIDYIEITTPNIDTTREFLIDLFGWTFTDYGDDYTSFEDGRLSGGLRRGEPVGSTESGSVLVVFYSANLETTEERVVELGGSIVTPTFEFPGGRRFHFAEPCGNEFAVWSDR